MLSVASRKGFFKVAVTCSAILAVVAVVAMPVLPMISLPAAWSGYGGNAQHTSISKYKALGLGKVAWSVSIDEDSAAESSGTDLYIHYASPCITSINPVSHKGNTVIVAVHNNSGGQHDSWRVEGLDGSNSGALKWSFDSGWSAPVKDPYLNPSNWTSVYPLSIVNTNSVVAASGGGTVLYVPNADLNGPVSPVRFCFYAPVATYLASPSTYQNIKICTPITGDARGNFFFGYTVTDPTGIPAGILANIGTGGVVKFNTAGRYTYRTAASLVSGMVRPAINCAPALSNDGLFVYFGIRATSSNKAYLVKLNAMDPAVGNTDPTKQTLALQAAVHLVDPINGSDSILTSESSASPMVAPDGHVFYGVLCSYNHSRESHGWLLQFDKNLNQYDLQGYLFPVGGFGWDDTPSVVPSAAVPSYTGASSYLILSKYNNYHIYTGDGRNHLAILDPSNTYVFNASYTTPIVVSTTTPHLLQSGQKVILSGIKGNTNANGTFYAKPLSSTSFALYVDSGLSTAVAGNAAYTSGGTVSGSIDRLNGTAVMKEISLVTGVTCDSDYYACTPTTDVTSPSVPVREWCVNAAAIDVADKFAVVNSEDGHAYKWDFVTNTLKQGTLLQPATGEAYTCTVIGPDGTAYAINNSVLHAIVPVPGP